jgi:TruD family tRNA pseudouridine synthase
MKDYSADILKYQNSPASFSAKMLYEDDALLGEFGISIPNRDKLPSAFFKLYPSDFIVEEVGQNGEVCTVDSNVSVPSDYSVKGLWAATLVKCNMGTHDVVLEIAKTLNVSVDAIQYAGLKDEFAITAQKITINGVTGDQVASLKSEFYFFKDIGLVDKPLKKGGLKGNRFTITLRFPKQFDGGNIAAIDKAIESVSQNGFYNYYYLQRFGLPRLNNHYIASLLLHGDYQGALFAFFCDLGKDTDSDDARTRQSLESMFENWKEMSGVLAHSSKTFSYELEVLGRLISKPHDLKGAIRSIPNVVMIWIYSLSSWFFNNQLSNLIQEGKVPHSLPLVLSSNQRDVDFYKYFLTKLKAYPPVWSNVREVMPALDLRSRHVDTKVSVTFNKVVSFSGGIVISFDLGKGSYATTLLAHLVKLISYAPPADINYDTIDAKGVLGTGSLNAVKEMLSDTGKPVFLEPSSRI